MLSSYDIVLPFHYLYARVKNNLLDFLNQKLYDYLCARIKNNFDHNIYGYLYAEV